MSENNTRPNKLTSLPLSRIRTIMKSSPEVLNLSQDSVFLISKAAEMFVQYLAKEAYNVSGNKSRIEYGHVAEVVNSKEYLEFLQDIIPRKMKAKDYWEILQRVEEEERKLLDL